MSAVARASALVVCVAPLGLGALAARALAARHPASLAVDFAQPLVVATTWHAYGAAAVAILGASVGLAAVLTGAIVARLRAAAGPRDGAAIVLAAALGLGAAAAWPFVFSSDVYAYAAYGDLALHGLDPYAPAPPALHDAFLDAARWQWAGPFPVDVYGPATLAPARAIVALAGSGRVAAALAALRLAAAGAFLASVALLYAALRDLPAAARFATTCAYALNPAILWTVAEGHNDAAVAALAALGALAIARGRGVGGGVLLGLTPLVKAPGLALALGFALDALVRRTDRAARAAAAATVIALSVAVGFALPPLLHALGHVARVGTYAPRVSLQGLVGPLPALLVASAAVVLGLARIGSGERRGYAWLGIALVAALPNAYPWYALWLVPWALASGGGPAAIGLWVATICAVARYLPDAAQPLDGAPASLLAAAAVAPLGLALFDVVPRHPKKDPNRS